MNLHTLFALETVLYALIGMGIAAPFLYLNVFLAPRFGWIDWPKSRGLTEEQVPIIGHSIVLLTLFMLLGLNTYYALSPWFLMTAIGMAVMGHIDDKISLDAIDKLICQVSFALVVTTLDPQLQTSIATRFGSWGVVCAVFFIVGLVNAINFIDGIDGLAGTVIMIGTIGFILLAHVGEFHSPYELVAGAVCGMMIPFLYLNIFKRYGFLGNVGSYFFSYILVIFHLSLPFQSPGILSRLSLTGLCFLIPIADSCMVFSMRLLMLRSPFQPDKGHLHHRLLQTSIHLRYVLLNFTLIEIAAMLTAVLFGRNPAIRSSTIPVYLCLSHIAISAILIYLIERASRRRVQSYMERLDAEEPIYYMKFRVVRSDGSLLSPTQLYRLEARVGSEIRVTDFCFIEKPDILFVTLRSMKEPLKGISARIDRVFQLEKVTGTQLVEYGEIVKRVLSHNVLRKSA